MGKRKPKVKFEDTWLGRRLTKKIDDLSVEGSKSALHTAAVTVPFILAERKVGGSGLGGAAVGLLADRLIKDQIDAPSVTILGSTYKVNAGYAMLLGATGFLGANALFWGLLNVANASSDAVIEMMKQQEEAQKEWLKVVHDPISTPEDIGRAQETYSQNKVWRK